MNFAALVATMVALASPTAHGDFQITCADLSAVGGLAYPWEGRIVLTPYICRSAFKTILHRHVKPAQASLALSDLLHEAAHVGQWRESIVTFQEPDRWFEHDAECRSLRALPDVLKKLHYRCAFVATATLIARTRITTEAPPYGGLC